MAKEYIERETVKAWLHEEDFGTPDERWRPESEFGAMIDALPAADVVEVKHGEWIKHESMVLSRQCSNCKGWYTKTTINEYTYSFCPHCGAKMDGERKEQE